MGLEVFDDWKTEPSSETPEVQNSGAPSQIQPNVNRTPKRIRVELQGNHTIISGETVDVSPVDVRIRVTDPNLLSEEALANPQLVMQKVADEFVYGLGVHFPDISATCTGRMNPPQPATDGEQDPFIITCSFDREMELDIFLKVKSHEDIDGEPEWKRYFNVKNPENVKNPASTPVETAGMASSTATPGDPQIKEADLKTFFSGMDPELDKKENGEPSLVPMEAVEVKTSHHVEVKGDRRTFSAQAINMSSSGVLIHISDADLKIPAGPGREVFLNKIITDNFSKGLLVRFQKGGLSIKANPVRMGEITVKGEKLTVIECEICNKPKVEESAPPSISTQETTEPVPVPVESMDSVNPAEEQPMETAAPAPAPIPIDIKNIRELMKHAMERKASDLHIKAGSPPRLRISGTFVKIGEKPVTPEHACAMAQELMNPEQTANFEKEKDAGLASTVEGVGRFRINIFRQQEATGLAIRCIPGEIPTIESLGLHPETTTLAEKPHGLVLVIGPAGSGKSTTLAALVNHVNQTRPCHIITIEDPVEFIHLDAMAQITQREIGRDVLDITWALERALRQDPDVLLVSEIRNPETLALVLTAAETGRLVFAAMQTTSAALTLARIIEMFPLDRQAQIRLQLADSLQGIITQRLNPGKDGAGMMALDQDVFVIDEALSTLIREDKTSQIAGAKLKACEGGIRNEASALDRLVQDR